VMPPNGTTSGVARIRVFGLWSDGSTWRASWRSVCFGPVPMTADLGVAPGQLNHCSFNQRWKVRMLAGWDHHTVWPAHAPFLQPHGRELTQVTRADLEAFIRGVPSSTT
jgi:hypothetical protein